MSILFFWIGVLFLCLQLLSFILSCFKQVRDREVKLYIYITPYSFFFAAAVAHFIGL